MSKATETPVFLVGPQRSGTTMLSLMLKHHPKLAWAGEMEYVTEYISDDISSINMDNYYQSLEIDRGVLSTKLNIDRSLSYPDLMRSFLEQHRVRQQKPLVGATVHGFFHRLPSIWPQARFIYLLRDGRDVTRSCIQMGWAGNFWTGATRWLRSEEQWSSLNKLVNPNACMVVKYEELLANPVAILTRICVFLGLEYRPEMMSYDENTTYSKPDPKYAYQWKRKLSEKELRLCEARISSQLVDRGYTHSGLDPLRVSSIDDLKLKAHDKLVRIRYRVNCYGWKLVILSAVARRLRLTSFDKQLQLQMHKITNSSLK